MSSSYSFRFFDIIERDEKEVKKMEKTLYLILEKLDSLDHKVNKLDQRLDKMEHSFTVDQNRQDDLLHQLINNVAITNVKVSEMSDKVATLESKVDSVILEIKEIKTSMATKHDLEYYDQMISEDSRQIYKLKKQ
jgi:uncharacterized coiled-coil protein SlyX